MSIFLVYVWWSNFVQYNVKFFALQHVSIFNDLHRPWECLIQCLLPERVLRIFWTGLMRWLRGWKETRCEVFFSWSFPTRQINFQRGHFSEQSILHLNGKFYFSSDSSIFIFCFILFFTPPFLWYGFKFEHDPWVSVKTLGAKLSP